MGKGWGYGKNSRSPADIIYNSCLHFKSDTMKVYKCNLVYFGYLTITIIISPKRNTIVIKQENYKSISYDVSFLKTKKEISIYIQDTILEKYYYTEKEYIF